jgi:RNA recognition motif-containing protein
MRMKIYAGNLPYSVGNEELHKAFEEFGAVETAEVIMERDTNRSKGFGFVEMVNDEEAKAAIAGLAGKDMDGRTVKISEAKPKRTDTRSQGPRSFRY